jgi:hypothetical protein
MKEKFEKRLRQVIHITNDYELGYASSELAKLVEDRVWCVENELNSLQYLILEFILDKTIDIDARDSLLEQITINTSDPTVFIVYALNSDESDLQFTAIAGIRKNMVDNFREKLQWLVETSKDKDVVRAAKARLK